MSHIPFPERFYLACTFCDQPPPGANPIREDTIWWLHALHEQATKGPCKHPRPNPFDPWNGEFRFWDEAPEITWDAYKALRDTTPHEAMARYVATVEMENPHWWDVMTSGMDDTRKGALVSSAADCAREYHDAVKAGLLPYEPALAERSIAKGTASTSTRNGHGSSAANGIAAMLSGVLNGVLNDDEAEAEAEPEWRAPEPVAEQGELADFPSLLDDRTVMHAWTAVATTGDEPVPRCGHCAWTRGAREMWVTHGNVNGRKLAGGPKVLDLATMSWSTRRARSALDHDPENPNPPLARIAGASAVLAPNGAAYVFGGAERLPDPSGDSGTHAARARLATRLADVKAGRKAPMMSVRALDLETRPATADDGRARRSPEARRAEVDSEGNVVVVGSDPDDSPAAPTTTDDDSEMEWIDATPYADKENGENGKDRFTAIAPAPRMLHSATLIGGDVYVFGGVMLGADNAERRDDDVVLGDLWAYDGAEGTWRLVHRGERSTGMSSSSLGGGKAQLPPAEAPPCPRAGHCACAVDDRFLLIWGGDEGEQRGMAPIDLHVFDTWANRWVQPTVLGEARAPKPRSGASSCVVGTRWFISGGGDGAEARPETHALECRDARAGVFQWTLINSASKPEDKEAAGKEKASMVGFRAKSGDFLVMFGGFGGFGCSGLTRVMRVSTR